MKMKTQQSKQETNPMNSTLSERLQEPRKQPSILMQRDPAATPVLRFTPTAWAKLLYFRDYGNTEIGGFGVAAADDLLLMEDFVTVKQDVTVASISFDDDAVADFFDIQVDQGQKPEQFARVWLHSHPGNSPNPSSVDEDTFISDIRCISQLYSLQGLIVKGCNNVFSADIPKHDTLSVLVLRNIANLQKCHELVESVDACFPNLQDFQLNDVKYSERDLDLSPLQRLKHPVRLQAVGTRVTDESGQFSAYCEERRLIQRYIDSLSNDATEAHLGWAAVHRDDLAVLAEDKQHLRKIKLRGCSDLASIDNLANLPELSSLWIEDCKGISSLESLAKNRTLQELTIQGCTAVSDYQCLSSCRTLKRLNIKGGKGGGLSDREYAQQMAQLHIEHPNGCDFTCDVSDNELTSILEESDQYHEALKRELAHLDIHVGYGGHNVN